MGNDTILCFQIVMRSQLSVSKGSSLEARIMAHQQKVVFLTEVFISTLLFYIVLLCVCGRFVCSFPCRTIGKGQIPWKLKLQRVVRDLT